MLQVNLRTRRDVYPPWHSCWCLPIAIPQRRGAAFKACECRDELRVSWEAARYANGGANPCFWHGETPWTGLTLSNNSPHGHIWMLMTGLISACTQLPSTKAGPGWWLGGWVAWLCWCDRGIDYIFALLMGYRVWISKCICKQPNSLKRRLRTILSWMQQMTAWQLLNIVRILQLASKCVMDCTTTCNLHQYVQQSIDKVGAFLAGPHSTTWNVIAIQGISQEANRRDWQLWCLLSSSRYSKNKKHLASIDQFHDPCVCQKESTRLARIKQHNMYLVNSCQDWLVCQTHCTLMVWWTMRTFFFDGSWRSSQFFFFPAGRNSLYQVSNGKGCALLVTSMYDH